MSAPYLVVSVDSHAGPSLERSLRPYCPPPYLEEYDAFVRAFVSGEIVLSHADRNIGAFKDAVEQGRMPAATSETARMCWECAGHDDPHARLRDMDESGIAAEVIFAGGQNNQVLPFMGFAADAGPTHIRAELRVVGEQIWNRWLADFVSVAPDRLLGVMQIPIWDLDRAVSDVRWGKEQGLRAVNLPGSRRDFPPYNHSMYEPLWSVCEELRLPLVTHSGGGDAPAGVVDGDDYLPGGRFIHTMERHWFTRRHLWQMIFGGVFERHPGLKLVLTEQPVEWFSETMAQMSGLYGASANRKATYDEGPDNVGAMRTARSPAEYWASNCYVGASFMTPAEVAMRHEIGVANLMWGSDYPHLEGTWPHTRLALRHTFAGVPEPDVRAILGGNALSVYDLDESVLRPLADRIGPRPSDVDESLRPDELPAHRSNAFRESLFF